MMAKRGAADGATPEIVVYSDCDTLSHALMKELGPLNAGTSVKPLSSLQDLSRQGGQSGIREIVVDVRSNLNETELRTLRDRMNGTRIIGLGDDATLECYRRLREAGCDEYFVIDQELPRAIRYIAGQDNTGGVRHIAVHGIKSGIGTSLISAALARFISERHSVDIVDLNFTHPSINYWLGEDRAGVLHRLVGFGARIDSKMTDQIALSVNQTIRYLGGYDVMGTARFDADDAARLFGVLGTQSCTLWRTDTGNPHISAYALQHADATVLVTDRSLSSLRAVNDMTAHCQQIGRRVVIVINDPYAESDIKVSKFRTLLQGSDVIVLPRVRRLKVRLLDGIVPGSRRSGLYRSIRRIAGRLDPQWNAPKRRWIG